MYRAVLTHYAMRGSMKEWNRYEPPASAASARPTRFTRSRSPARAGSVRYAAAYMLPTLVPPASAAPAVSDQRSLLRMCGITTSCMTSDAMLPTAVAPAANMGNASLRPPGNRISEFGRITDPAP